LITLITGAPGTGKTALLVEWLRTLYADRPIYAHGLNGLKLPHTPIDAARWHLDLPDGAILVVDEVQQVWRPRGPGHAPSDAVKALETHRHRGIDVFVTTQKPNLVDANVRGLVGRHVHLRDTGWLGRHQYEWPEVSENLAWKTCPLKRRYKLPRAAFGLYKSSVEHTTVQKGRSLMPLITGVLVVGACVLAFMVYRAIASHTSPKPQAVAVEKTSSGSAPAFSSAPASAVAGSRWPLYDSTPVEEHREPYAGRAFYIEGGYTVGRKQFAWFGVLVDGKRVATVSLKQLVSAGYSYTEVGPCSGVLRFRQVERPVTCGAPTEVAARSAWTPGEPVAASQGSGGARPVVSSPSPF